MLAIVASMEREVSALKRSRGRVYEGMLQGEPQAGPFLSGVQGSVMVHVAGVGKDRALAGMKALIDGPLRPDAILSLGFGGALRRELATGDLVLSQRLHALGEEAVFEPDAGLLSLAQEALESSGAPRHFVAETLTVPQVVSSAGEKQRLAGASAAWVADMEDYWVAKAAAQTGIPFLSARAVLDTADQELPPFVAGIGDKGVLSQLLRVAAHGITRPWDAPRLLKLSKQLQIAQDSLAVFGLSFVARMATAGSYARL